MYLRQILRERIRVSDDHDLLKRWTTYPSVREIDSFERINRLTVASLPDIFISDDPLSIPVFPFSFLLFFFL